MSTQSVPRYVLVRRAGSVPNRRLQLAAIMEEITSEELLRRARMLESVRVWFDGRNCSERRYAYNVVWTWQTRPSPEEVQQAKDSVLTRDAAERQVSAARCVH